MSLKAGFAEIDISPALGVKKVGWIKEIVIDRVADPIHARAAILQSEAAGLAFIQLDVIAIQWSDVEQIRRRITDYYSFPGEAIMVSATHNHAGPAVLSLGEVLRDADYVESMIEKIVLMFGEAHSQLQEAQIGIGSTQEWRLSHNRRMVMRDGTTSTHTGYGNPNALYVEGPIDPEVAVLAARRSDGKLLGAMVNFACHPTHHGGDTTLSAGFPGVMAREMKEKGCPVTLFLNGAAGNISSGDPLSGPEISMEEQGRALAKATLRALAKADWRERLRLEAHVSTVELPFREITEEQVRGTARGAQRFIDPAIYDRAMPELVEKLRREGSQPVEIQALSLDEFVFVSNPAELFVELGLRIKEEIFPRRGFVVSFTNGYVGYVPHLAAFERGGYETTFGWGSFLAPQAGDRIADHSIEQVRKAASGSTGA